MVLIAYMIKDHPLQLHNSSCQSPRIIIFDHHHRPQAVVVVVVMMSNIKITYWSNWHCPSPLRNYHHRPHNGQPWRSTLRRPRILHISTAECWTLKKYIQLQRRYIMLLLAPFSLEIITDEWQARLKEAETLGRRQESEVLIFTVKISNISVINILIIRSINCC